MAVDSGVDEQIAHHWKWKETETREHKMLERIVRIESFVFGDEALGLQPLLSAVKSLRRRADIATAAALISAAASLMAVISLRNALAMP